MKALILNSGIGKRMGGLTRDKCKCMAELADGVTILDEQLKRLANCGITDICITTGPFASDLERYARARYAEADFTFVHNPMYDRTNYIYSIYLARDVLKGDIVMLHGDLVFETSVLENVLSSVASVMVTDSAKPLPEKDFKAAVDNGRIVTVGVNVFENAVYAQPLYKLNKEDWKVWLDEICKFCEDGNTGVYAEDAFNNVGRKMNLFPMDAAGRLCFEVDNEADLAYAGSIWHKLS